MVRLILSFCVSLILLSNYVFSTEIIKVNDHLLSAEKKSVHFALEKVVDEADYQKWINYIQFQKDAQNKLVSELKSKIIEIWGTPTEAWGAVMLKKEFKEKLEKWPNENDKKLIKLEPFITTMNDPLKQMEGMLNYYAFNDVWIAYISDKTTTKKYSDDNIDDIIMTVAVVTAAKIPFNTNMGITRAPINVERVLKGQKNPPPGLSIDLHSFVAKALNEVSETKKLFMITSPLKKMREIVEQHFRNQKNAFQNIKKGAVNNLIVLSTEVIPPKKKRKKAKTITKLILKDWDNQIILEANSKQTDPSLSWFFYYASRDNPLMIIDNMVLAEAF